MVKKDVRAFRYLFTALQGFVVSWWLKVRCGQRGAPPLYKGMLACDRRGQFLRFRIKWEPCPAHLSCARRKAASKPSWASTLMLLGHAPRTQRPHTAPPCVLSHWAGGSQSSFFSTHACLSLAPSLRAGSSPSYQPQKSSVAPMAARSLLPNPEHKGSTQRSCSLLRGNSCAEKTPRIPARLQGKDINPGGEQRCYNKKVL